MNVHILKGKVKPAPVGFNIPRVTNGAPVAAQVGAVQFAGSEQSLEIFSHSEKRILGESGEVGR